MKLLVTILLVSGALLASALAFVYSGIFNVAADAPHTAFTQAILESVRSRSIATRARNIRPPPLDDAALIATGAGHYAAMCSGCHLAPDWKVDSEMRAGLYPKPPDLTRPLRTSPTEAFWVIKHGIKMSGMPAWGKTHDDASIWALVAFLQKLPGLSPAQYLALAKSGAESQHRHANVQHAHTDGGEKSRPMQVAPKGEHHHPEQ
jgi:mono/diheme cytochrome c family protein